MERRIWRSVNAAKRAGGADIRSDGNGEEFGARDEGRFAVYDDRDVGGRRLDDLEPPQTREEDEMKRRTREGLQGVLYEGLGERSQAPGRCLPESYPPLALRS